ncbi:Rpn family recombination-promoting nuclease/putative transposase [Chloroflexi bacterium TSY]|nr:Rpn family recombination-promoting nuclease/putative transposase [Chloroflexi bacterium TSY]
MSIHDNRFFHFAFSHRDHAREFLENYLPLDVLPLLDLNALELKDGSYIRLVLYKPASFY